MLPSRFEAMEDKLLSIGYIKNGFYGNNNEPIAALCKRGAQAIKRMGTIAQWQGTRSRHSIL
jgi:hypothetical protein